MKSGSGSPTSQPSSRVPSQQKVILDIERALSAKDLSGLEKCYKRIFHVSRNISTGCLFLECLSH